MNKFTPEEMGLEEVLSFGVPFSDGSATLVPLEQPYAQTLQWKAAQHKMTVPDYVVKVLMRAQAEPSSPQNDEDYEVPDFLRRAHRACHGAGCTRLIEKLWPLVATMACLTLLLPDLYDYIQ
jgi:hypothetical protein